MSVILERRERISGYPFELLRAFFGTFPCLKCFYMWLHANGTIVVAYVISSMTVKLLLC